jgi:4-hydroxybenzoate polyprenyltransferase
MNFSKTIAFIIISSRPSQWVKNFFVLAPLIFAMKLTDQISILYSLAAFFAFTLISGSVYIINDIMDIERDKIHPVKCMRPVPSGKLQISHALSGSLVMFAVSIAVSFFLGTDFLITAVFYFILNLGYSFRLKAIPYVDVLSISMGFLLRIISGCFAINLHPQEISYWILICTFLVAVYLALGKRRSELANILSRESGNSIDQREVLKKYRMGHIDIVMNSSGMLTALIYGLYTVSERTVAFFHTRALVFTIPFVIFGLFRFKMIVSKQGLISPTERIVRDIPFLLNLCLWAVTAVSVIYFGIIL